MNAPARAALKPRALIPGSRLAVMASASPADDIRTMAGLSELKRLGFALDAYQIAGARMKSKIVNPKSEIDWGFHENRAT